MARFCFEFDMHPQPGSGSKGSWVWLKGVMCSPARLPLAFIFSLRGGLKSLRRMNLPRPQDWTVLALGLGSFLAICATVSFLDAPMKELKKQSWLASLAYNLITYSAIFLPGFVILKYVVKTQFLESGPKFLSPAISLCFFGNNDDTIDDSITGDFFINIIIFFVYLVCAYYFDLFLFHFTCLATEKEKVEASQTSDEWRRAVHL